MIAFDSSVETVEFIDPAGCRTVQRIEHRVDPLTHAVASINTVLGEKARAFLGVPDVALLRQLEQETRSGCPFCGVLRGGTRFVPETLSEPLLRAGTAVAVPNLFAKCAVDAVVVLDPGRHVLFPSAVGRDGLRDALQVAAEVVRRARARDARLVHHVAGMNFLPPGGSSVPHPHLQVHARATPYSGVDRIAELCRRHAARAGRSYWAELLEHERHGPRWIGETGRVGWIVPFAPSHQKEVWGVVGTASSLAELDAADAEALATGIDRVVTTYEEQGRHAFTLATLSSPAPDRDFALHVKICARPAFRPLYPNHDTWFTPKLLGDDVHTEAPEDLATALRARW